MAGLSTHVLDTSRGAPAAGVAVCLEHREPGGWSTWSEAITDADGRVGGLVPSGRDLVTGEYRLTFGTEAYFAARGASSFYPTVTVEFRVADPTAHYHVPLLLSPWGYTTYRGS